MICDVTYSAAVAAKIHMNVRCHWSAPPSQPPSLMAFGTCSIKSVSGILAPKLGKALRIWNPLMARTSMLTALAQWQNRTAQGCS